MKQASIFKAKLRAVYGALFTETELTELARRMATLDCKAKLRARLSAGR